MISTAWYDNDNLEETLRDTVNVQGGRGVGGGGGHHRN